MSRLASIVLRGLSSKPNVLRKSIKIPAIDTTLDGWFFSPVTDGPAPTIIMSHGFTALKEHHLEQYANLFAANGLASIIFDHRNFGSSGGEPRQEIDPLIQARDYRHAITFAEALDAVDSSKIGVWGTSLSGGHALTATALDHRIKCTVTQVPFISGYLNRIQKMSDEQVSRLCDFFDEARRQRSLTGKPTYMTAVSDKKEDKAVLKSSSAFSFFKSVPKWDNRVTVRSIELISEYDPLNYIDRINNTPVLFIVADNDDVNDAQFARQAYDRLKSPKDIITVQGDHFCPYFGKAFGVTSQAACRWFLQHLGEPSIQIKPSL